MAHDLPAAVTAFLDTNGVHPYDDRWYTAYEMTFEAFKRTSIEIALSDTLDFLEVNNADTRRSALNNFWQSLIGTPGAVRASLEVLVESFRSKKKSGKSPRGRATS